MDFQNSKSYRQLGTSSNALSGLLTHTNNGRSNGEGTRHMYGTMSCIKDMGLFKVCRVFYLPYLPLKCQLLISEI